MRKSITALGREEERLRPLKENGTFEASISHLFDVQETRECMRRRYIVADDILIHFNNIDAVETALGHMMELLHLSRVDVQGNKHTIPALYLRLGRDQECYDFVKWWATTGERESYDWDEVKEPFLDVKGADVFESPEGL